MKMVPANAPEGTITDVLKKRLLDDEILFSACLEPFKYKLFKSKTAWLRERIEKARGGKLP